jgi:hypothetical protein
MKFKRIALTVSVLIIFSVATLLYVGNMAPGKAGRRLALWQQHAPWKSININTQNEAPQEGIWPSLQKAASHAQDIDSYQQNNNISSSIQQHTSKGDEQGKQRDTKTSKKQSQKGGDEHTQRNNHKAARKNTLAPGFHNIMEQERFAWSRAWSSDAVRAIYPELVNNKDKNNKTYHNTSCSASMPHIIMHKINGSALTTTMHTHAKVITASPSSLLSTWNQTSLASEFVYGEVRWVEDAVYSVSHIPTDVITSTRSSAPHHDFGAYLHRRDAVLAASQLSAHRNESGLAVREPWPGLMVMYNARFWTRSVFVNDCRIVYASCCW